MLKAFQIIFEPSATWAAIDKAGQKLWQVTLLYLVPTLIIACTVEAWGLHKLGKRSPAEGVSDQMTLSVAKETVLQYEASQALLLLLMIFFVAKVYLILLQSMHCRVTYDRVFKTVAYCFAPYFLTIACDAIPVLPSWICRIIGGFLVVNALYIGLVRVIKPEPTVALGAFLIGAILLLAAIGITHLISLSVLEDQLLERLLNSLRG